MKRHKFRTFLTAFGVFWGLFMLVMMMGVGNGLQNGVLRAMFHSATNACYIWGSRTSIAYMGFQPGRRVKLKSADALAIQEQINGIEYFAPRTQLGGHRGSTVVRRKSKTGNFSIYGDVEDFINIHPLDIYMGRFINPLDIVDKRKVAVIGHRVAELLFSQGEKTMGEYIYIKGVYFKIIGVFRSYADGDAATRDEQKIHIPLSTFQQAFNTKDRLGWFAITANSGTAVREIEQQVKRLLAVRHNVHPKDLRAYGSSNREIRYNKIMALFKGIRWFVWFVGVGTLLAGIVGVSNVMLVGIKERTKEIGIRKALGATPFSIVSMIVNESLVLTAIAGYSGLFSAVVLLETFDRIVQHADNSKIMFTQPGINFEIALVALLILIVSGLLAAVIPSRHAARIDPIISLRAE